MTASTLTSITAADVHRTVGRYILADGFDQIFDFEKSHGSWFHDARSGREYLDFLSFFASSPLGYNHPQLKDPQYVAVLMRAASVKPALSDIYTTEYAWAVDVFGRHLMRPYLTHAFFVEGGTMGVENALKAAFDWKIRRNRAKGIRGERGTQVIHFEHAFHGRSGYTLSLTNTDPVKTDLFPKFPWPRVKAPMLRFPTTPDVLRDVVAAEQEALDQIRSAFAGNADDIAAVIIEPIQGEGGDNQFRGEFLRAVEKLCDDNEAFFIVDEVQTGVGLTGRMWAHEHFGLTPDALAFGKKTQVCGCFVGPKVDQEPENVFAVSSRLNSTWGGALVDLVRGARYLEIIESERLVENARVVGAHLLAGLTALQNEIGGLMSGARGLGLMIAFDVPDRPTRDKVQARLIENGLLVLTCGTRSIRFRPPLDLSTSEADTGLDIVRKTLKQF
jgi:L-lysine 6-transaminase